MERPIKELLTILKSAVIETKNLGGMCGIIKKLAHKTTITFEESLNLELYLKQNDPKSRHSVGNYWYKPGDKGPRLRWLDTHIQQN